MGDAEADPVRLSFNPNSVSSSKARPWPSGCYPASWASTSAWVSWSTDTSPIHALDATPSFPCRIWARRASPRDARSDGEL